MGRLFILLIPLSCGSPSYTTDRFNIDVYDDTTGNKMTGRSKEVDDVAGLTVANYCACHGAVEKLDGLEVHFTDGKVDCGDKDAAGCADLDEGWYDRSEFLSAEWVDCIPLTPLGHELVHYFEWELHHRDTGKHDNQHLWGVWGVVNTTVVNGVEAMCPELSSGD